MWLRLPQGGDGERSTLFARIFLWLLLKGLESVIAFAANMGSMGRGAARRMHAVDQLGALPNAVAFPRSNPHIKEIKLRLK